MDTCGKTGEKGEKKKKNKEKEAEWDKNKEACWREDVRGRAGNLILNVENSMSDR